MRAKVRGRDLTAKRWAEGEGWDMPWAVAISRNLVGPRKKKRHGRWSYPCREASDANYFRSGDAPHNRNKYTIA